MKNSNIILKTKLQKPNLPNDYIYRNELIQCLMQDIDLPLILISAGAGYGKSLFVSSWADAIQHKTAWFSIDEQDNDIRIFLNYFVSAIKTQQPNFGTNIYRNIFLSNVQSLDILTNNLINDLADLKDDIYLVLDDFQNINNTDIIDLVSNIINQVPKKFHFVIISRVDPDIPLDKYRAGGQIKSISSSHLKLSEEEVKAFVQKNFSNYEIENIISIFNNRFEGWVTGIRLLKIHMAYTEGDIEKLKQFIEKNRLSETYFIEELIKYIDEDTLKFLLQTSLLRKFNSELSEYILLSENTSNIIDELLRNNLFIINLDSYNRWFRYHNLFQDTLQAELKKSYSKDEILSIHKRAIEWFVNNNSYEDAFYHVIQCEDDSVVAEFVRENMYKPLNENRWFVLENWLKHISDDSINNCPVLLTAQMWVMQHKGVYWVIPDLISRVEQIKSSSTELYDGIKHQLVFFKAVLNFWNDNISDSIEQFEYVKQNMSNDKLGAMSLSTIYFANASYMIGNGDKVYNDLQSEITRNNIPDNYKPILLASLVYIKLLEGDLFVAERITKRIADLCASLNNDFYTVWYEFFMGYITIQQYRTEEAFLHYQNALKLVYLLNTHAPIDAFAGALITSKLNNNNQEYERIEKQLTSLVYEWSNPAYNTIAYSLRTRLSILDNDIQQAITNFKKSDMSFNSETIIFNLEVPKITHCKLLLAKNTKQSIGEAINRLVDIQSYTERIYNIPQTIEVLILLSVAFYKINDITKAVENITKAVVLAEKGHIVYPFTEQFDIVNILLSKIESDRAKIVEYIKHLKKQILRKEILTNREFEIINLLALRLSNQEIANNLFISVPTTKRHIINIYQKLGVNKRQDAVNKAIKSNIIKVKV
jgi:LuxR family maltose regulon positive regulatory protein